MRFCVSAGYTPLAFWSVSVGCDLRTAPAGPTVLRKVPIMATLFKPVRPYPLPTDAEIIDNNGEPHIRIRDGKKTLLHPAL